MRKFVLVILKILVGLYFLCGLSRIAIGALFIHASDPHPIMKTTILVVGGVAILFGVPRIAALFGQYLVSKLNRTVTRWTWFMAIGEAAELVKENMQHGDINPEKITKAISRANFYGNRYREACGLGPLPDGPGLNMFDPSKEAVDRPLN